MNRYDAIAVGQPRVGLLLPNTAWGRSNSLSLDNAAPAAGVTLVAKRWYNWGDASLLKPYMELLDAGAEAVILVANETEGALFIKELASLPPDQRLPVVSHWGITGGKFARLSGEALQEVELAVIQTYSFVGRDDPAARRVLRALKQDYGVETADQVKSPVGVAHAYDLTHLLARAIDRAGSTDRRQIRDAMERLGPYQGLVRHYPRPFTAERHDALSAGDVFFARYTADDKLLPVGSE